MDITKNDNLFPYIEGDFLVGRPDVILTVTTVQDEEMADHKGRPVEKVTIGFRETGKRLVLNKTNAKTLIKLYGKETNDWQEKRIAVYSEKVKAFGETHNTVRIRDKVPAAKRNGEQPEQPALMAAEESIKPVDYYKTE